MRGIILLYDNQPERRRRIGRFLADQGHEVHTMGSRTAAIEGLQKRLVDLAFYAGTSDTVLDLLERSKSLQPRAEVIVASERPTVETAVEAIKHGAFYYLPSLSSLERISLLVDKALEKHLLATEVNELREIIRGYSNKQIIGESPAIQELKKTVKRIANIDCNILIYGETGTGKELVAHTIHAMSHRADRKFLAINCGALTEELLSNELFGHEKGAFTGANFMKKGIFEAATQGTLLLDEIGDTTLSMQVKLLRVLQERCILRVGGTQEIPVDVRVLAATHKNLREAVAAGTFREDLFYRLNSFTLRMPPLRDRRDDIPLFCRFFIDQFRKQFDKKALSVSREVMAVFMSYPFPGNIRELKNVIERAVVLCDGEEILTEHLPPRLLQEDSACIEPRQTLPTLAQMEADYIREVLAATNGNKAEAARILGIDRSSLWRKLKKIEVNE
ncbi:MAG: sigma-54 dependent transcriptional regulator [Desulfobia sp.]